jgi:hypothetical protein
VGARERLGDRLTSPGRLAENRNVATRGRRMSLLIIVLSILLGVAVYWRINRRARSAILGWARDYGYRVDSVRFHAILSSEYQEAGQEAELVYRVVLTSPSGDRHAGHFLLWGLLVGRMTVIVRWDDPDRGG